MIINPSEVVLDINNASPFFEKGGLIANNYNLKILPKQSILIECRDPFLAASFADFCSGLVKPSSGSVNFLGLDWEKIDEDRANALRGMIGRYSSLAGWVQSVGMDLNILWPQLYHTNLTVGELMVSASELALEFGLPGIPVVPPNRLSDSDLRRCQWVRAFLSKPRLLLLEYPLEFEADESRSAFMKALCTAHNNGSSSIWFAKDLSIWNEDSSLANFPRYRLTDDGLTLLQETT